MGIEGLAPYWFEVESFLYVSHRGDVAARLEAGYDVLVTQRLVLEPQVEATFAVQDVPELGVGSGLDDLELGVRLRYEIVRELAPYVGFSWARRTGGADGGGEGTSIRGAVSDGSLVAGLRWWY